MLNQEHESDDKCSYILQVMWVFVYLPFTMCVSPQRAANQNTEFKVKQKWWWFEWLCTQYHWTFWSVYSFTTHQNNVEKCSHTNLVVNKKCQMVKAIKHPVDTKCVLWNNFIHSSTRRENCWACTHSHVCRKCHESCPKEIRTTQQRHLSTPQR